MVTPVSLTGLSQDFDDQPITEIVSSRERLNQTIVENQQKSKQYLASARTKIDALKLFKKEIVADLEPVQQQLNVIKNKFEAKLHDKETNPDGVLMSTMQEYHQCLDLATTRLYQMLDSDQVKWEANLKNIKTGLDRMQQTLQDFSAEQELKLAQLLNPEKFIKLEQPQLLLRKLELVGEDVDQSLINFEWPTENDLELLGEPQFVRLRSFYFMSSSEDYQPVSRVTCIFDNGVKSPNIQSLNSRNEQQAMVEFDPAKEIRTIKFSVHSKNKIAAIGFFDEAGEEVACYDPEGYGFILNSTERHLEKDEQLAGVYGVKDHKAWFSSFGFIVLRKLTDGDTNQDPATGGNAEEAK